MALAYVAQTAAVSTNALPVNANVTTPSVGDLIIACVLYTGGTVNTGTCVDDQTGGTYTKLHTATFGTSNINTLTIWARDNLCTSTSTHGLTFDCTGTSTGRGFNVMRWSGFNVAGSSVKAKANTNTSVTAAGTPDAQFGSAISTNNAVIIFLGNETNTAGLTEPTGFTERSDLGFSSPTTGFEVVTRDSGETGSTVTFQSASASQFGVCAVELQAGTAGVTTKKLALLGVG